MKSKLLKFLKGWYLIFWPQIIVVAVKDIKILKTNPKCNAYIELVSDTRY